MKLDALDQAIVRCLQEDGTLPHRDLAKRCGSSEATIRRRVARLRRNDIMRIVAVSDPFKQGYPIVTIINMQIDQRQMNAVKLALARLKELRFIGVTVGAFDVVAEAWFQSSDEMLRFTSDILAQIPGIIRVEPLQIHEMVTYTYDWGKPGETSPSGTTWRPRSRPDTVVATRSSRIAAPEGNRGNRPRPSEAVVRNRRR